MFDRAHAFLTSGSKAKFLIVLVCSVVAAIDRTSTSRKTLRLLLLMKVVFAGKYYLLPMKVVCAGKYYLCPSNGSKTSQDD